MKRLIALISSGCALAILGVSIKHNQSVEDFAIVHKAMQNAPFSLVANQSLDILRESFSAELYKEEQISV